MYYVCGNVRLIVDSATFSKVNRTEFTALVEGKRGALDSDDQETGEGGEERFKRRFLRPSEVP